MTSWKLCRRSLLSKWKDNDKRKIPKFLGIIAIMSVSPLPRLHKYWSKDKNHRNLLNAEMMTKERFEMFIKMFAFVQQLQ